MHSTEMPIDEDGRTMHLGTNKDESKPYLGTM